ncbi:Protein fmp52, mitochondrial [Cadophora gregata]|uniref:Protein fmp52, mitochondrial n=1 Tax=Cadophora gregata TaxID=51156 RepID=UPI0026DBB996|nr:Protein fmp52, mitochondrial [Cadophora gregata]KAK0103425.1 Protein fmp52, mitochondrial [Cadophora gregata]KAK0107613.1 Protein fmp52, mitochondrial [Cadophora gregata f. sp. sojae]
MAATAVIGSTGLVGSFILSTLLSAPSVSTVYAIARRQPASTDAKLKPLVNKETSHWAASITNVTPPPAIFLSALGTTKVAAGSIEAQRKIDLDLNIEVAKAAKAAGVKIYVLVSTAGANSKSMIPYSKMKGELEESVKEIGFEHTIILRPGLLVGAREESRPAEAILRGVANCLGSVAHVLKDTWAQDAEVVGKAAVSAGLQALEGGKPKVWEIGQSEIVRLGRTEWKA